MLLPVDGVNLKSLRETLCLAQRALVQNLHIAVTEAIDVTHIRRLQRMINSIDVLRPLGPDGKHGDRHTEFCECEGVQVDYVHLHPGQFGTPIVCRTWPCHIARYEVPGELSENKLPHSRACGFKAHNHGIACSHNCPTCAGIRSRG